MEPDTWASDFWLPAFFPAPSHLVFKDKDQWQLEALPVNEHQARAGHAAGPSEGLDFGSASLTSNRTLHPRTRQG